MTSSRIMLILTFLTLLLPLLPAEAAEGGVSILALTQQDLNSDGRPDLTVIDCAFATDHDQVMVLDQGSDMQTASSWETATDFDNDVWIFDAGADGTAQLIIKFAKEDGRHVAMIYHDIDGDSEARYHLAGTQIVIDESEFWSVRVETTGSWSQSDNLYDAPMLFAIDGFRDLREPDDMRYHYNDREVDAWIELGDKDGDGVNDYLVRWNTNEVLRSQTNRGFWLYAQTRGRKPLPHPNAVFWPLLVGKHYYEGYRYFDRTPAIAIDWDLGAIDNMGLLGYPIEDGYHIYSYAPFNKHTVNDANFENPMAYYDMANDQDNWPELQVRFEALLPFDPVFHQPYRDMFRAPHLEINYSWDQANSNAWDYKMNLIANYPIDEVVEFPDFAIKSVPYDEVVPWVRDRTWDMAMLIHDNRPVGSSEGMFGKGWLFIRGYADGAVVNNRVAKDQYMMGVRDQPPAELFQDIEEDMRGEYSFHYYDTPKIYLSALDRQLHLSGAEAGVWNMDEGHYIRYANLDGDTYLDQWREEQDGAVLQQVNYSNGFYIHTGPAGDVLIKQTDVAPALLETQPPGNYDEWQYLEAHLQANQRDVAPVNFVGLLGLLPGPAMEIHGAGVTDFRPTDQDGFRFVLELAIGYRVSGPDLLELEGLAPGAYVVENHAGAFTVTPLTPAQLSLDVYQAAAGDAVPSLEIIVANSGGADVNDLTLVIETEDHRDRPIELARTSVQVLAGQNTRVRVDLPPTVAARATLRVRQEDSQGRVLASDKWVSLVELNTPQRVTMASLDQMPFLASMAVLSAAFVSLSVALTLRRQPGEKIP